MREFLRIMLLIMLGSIFIGPLLGIGFFLIRLLLRLFAVLFVINLLSNLLGLGRFGLWGFWW